MEITYDDFKKVQIKVGTVLEVKKNEKARKPSLVVKVDFGKEIGIKQSSAEDCLIPISLPKSTLTTRDGFLAFSFFLTSKTVPTLI